MFGDFPASNNVYASYIYGSGQQPYSRASLAAKCSRLYPFLVSAHCYDLAMPWTGQRRGQASAQASLALYTSVIAGRLASLLNSAKLRLQEAMLSASFLPLVSVLYVKVGRLLVTSFAPNMVKVQAIIWSGSVLQYLVITLCLRVLPCSLFVVCIHLYICVGKLPCRHSVMMQQ